MDGAVAASMREKGLAYRVIWGISVAHLQEMAAEIKDAYKDSGEKLAELARLLWQEDVRECKLLATLVMPHDMTADEAQQWMDTLTTREMAEWLAFNLLRHIPSARTVAEKALKGDDELSKICADCIMKRIS